MFRHTILPVCTAVLLVACTPTVYRHPVHTQTSQSKPHRPHNPNTLTAPHNDYLALIMASEQNSHGAVQNILKTARQMTLDERFIIRGGCWDYLDAAWTRAGIGRQMRQTVFQSSKNGPYADSSKLQAGDWLYHINHSHNNIEHSGMFIGWIDFDRKLGLTLSYAGGHRQESGRYRVYDLSSVYQIIRAPQ